jgi:hypothetical protein
MAMAVVSGTTQDDHLTCPRCQWRPPEATRTVSVSTVAELYRAVEEARAGDTILLADGRYALQRSLEISTPGVTLRSQRGNPDRVILHGRGMEGDHVGVAVGVGAANVTIADVTIGWVGFHAVQVRGERAASQFTLHNAKLKDTGQQLLKGSVADNGMVAADGLVACSEFAYTTTAPSDYTNGVDILGTRAWIIRDNRFFRIRGPLTRGWAAGPAILAWQGAEDTIIERNLVVDSSRGIALGLVARHRGREYDHLRGIVRNNVVLNLYPWGDEGIEANGAADARIEHNTVLVEGQVPWSISTRFASASARIRNNLSNRRIILRDGARATEAGNVVTATRRWFVDAPGQDLRLLNEAVPAIDAGIDITDARQDFDRGSRPVGRAADAGAFEFPRARPRGGR